MAAKNLSHISIIFVATFSVQVTLAADSTSTARGAIAEYARPLSFEPNRGQTNKQVDFLAHGTGYSLFLSRAEVVMVLHRSAPGQLRLRNAHRLMKSAAVRMRPVGGNASAPVEALGELPGKSNYLVDNVPEHWHTNIANYAKVLYRGVYPGIDMIYYGNQTQLEYDFVVSPGADPGSISLEFQGPSKVELDREGNAVMHTAAGDLQWRKPVAYQEVEGSRKLIACAYTRRGGHRVGFMVDAYDHTKPLIIDPELVYSITLGGGVDRGNAIAVDAAGNAYVTGNTGALDFPTTSDAFQRNLKGGSENAFVTKFNPNGEVIYSTYLGGSGFDTCPPFGCFNGDHGNGIAIDRYGNAYVTGDTASPDFPVKNAFQPTLHAVGGSTNAFVTKLDSAGSSLVYSTYLGGRGNTALSVADAGYGIAVDAEGSAYVVGNAPSADFPTKNAFQNQQGGENAFVAKLCSAGNALVYSTYLGGSSGFGDHGYGIAVDAHGSAYVTGYVTSSDFPTKNAFQKRLKSPSGNAFVTKFAIAGDSLVYSTYLGGSSDNPSVGDFGTAIAVDAHGNAYITGGTTSSDFPIRNAFQRNLKTGGDSTNVFVTKLDSAGAALVYSTYLGGSGSGDVFGLGDFGNAIAVDCSGNAYVTGQAVSRDFPIKNAFQPVPGGGSDAFVTKLGAAGTALVYSSYLGGGIGVGDQGRGIGVDADDNAYLTGYAGTADFPVTKAFQSVPGGVFVTKVSAH